MNVAAVLFDLDGTLLDHDGAAATAVVASFPTPIPRSSRGAGPS
ncbi:hypothetical protein [Actinomadura sp. J1-007]|nr:hypothetical protein [Actinomadura sp. J1-007]